MCIRDSRRSARARPHQVFDRHLGGRSPIQPRHGDVTVEPRRPMPGVPRTQPALSLSQICALNANNCRPTRKFQRKSAPSAENRGGAAAPWRSKNPQSAPSEANAGLRRKQSELRAPKIAAEPLRRGDPKIRRAHRAKRMRDCGVSARSASAENRGGAARRLHIECSERDLNPHVRKDTCT